MEHDASRFPLSAHPWLAANEKDFSRSLEMTNAGKGYDKGEAGIHAIRFSSISTYFLFSVI